MRIGVVTPAFNVGPYIGETIRSVLAQTHRDWTMLVVDDGSTDDTAAVARSFHDPRLRLLSQPNAGVSAARNCGAASVDCDAVLFLDGDDRLAPFALEVLAAAVAAVPRARAAVAAYQRGGRVYRPPSGDLLERLLVRNLFVNGGHLLIRQAAFQPFREDLRYGEDWECWVRLALQRPSSPSRTGPTMTGGEAAGGPFTATRDPRPLLFVRERPTSAYLTMATDPASFTPCLNAIHGNPALESRFTPDQRAALRRLAGAEIQWIIGRELIRHGQHREGLRWLGRSVMAQPNQRRAALLVLVAGMAMVPPAWRGPLRPYTNGHYW